MVQLILPSYQISKPNNFFFSGRSGFVCDAVVHTPARYVRNSRVEFFNYNSF